MDSTDSISATSLQLVRSYPASPEKIYAAWTDPEQLKNWFGPTDQIQVLATEVDLRIGGKYKIAMKTPDGEDHIAIGEYLELDPPLKLVFTWAWEGGPMAQNPSRVTVQLSPQGEGTQLTLLHEKLPDQDIVQKHNEGWTGCLSRLQKQVG